METAQPGTQEFDLGSLALDGFAERSVLRREWRASRARHLSWASAISRATRNRALTIAKA